MQLVDMADFELLVPFVDEVSELIRLHERLFQGISKLARHLKHLGVPRSVACTPQFQPQHGGFAPQLTVQSGKNPLLEKPVPIFVEFGSPLVNPNDSVQFFKIKLPILKIIGACQHTPITLVERPAYPAAAPPSWCSWYNIPDSQHLSSPFAVHAPDGFFLASYRQPLVVERLPQGNAEKRTQPLTHPLARRGLAPLH